MGIPGNTWFHLGDARLYRYSTSPTPIADFDYAGWVAALCQGEGVKFVPVLDFRGTAELDYLNDETFFKTGSPHGSRSGWNPVHVNEQSGVDVTKFQVARDGHLGCGAGSTSPYPAANHLNSGYNPLHPVVRARIVEIMQDLAESLGPFKKDSAYSGDIGFASVDNVGLLIRERARTSLLMHPNMGNIWDGEIPIDPEDWWQQPDWSYDDKTWGLFRAAYPDVPDDPPPPANRFVSRHTYLETAQRVEAYRQVRYYHLATLYKDMIDALGADGPNLALLYQAPSYPAVSITPGQLEPQDPRLARDFLNDGIALAATLHTWVPSRAVTSETAVRA